MTAGLRTEPRRRAPTEARVVLTCLAVAAVSLVLPATLTFDQWSWLVWGREILDLDLDTTGGPSWKPLPVVFTTVFAPFGDAAPELWMLTARTGTLLAVVVTFRLAARLAGTTAGLVAACLLVLTPDGDPRFLRLLGEGHVAPWSVALLLLAVDRHLDGRNRAALVLVGVAGLLRPEVWPFLGLLGLWLWSRDRRTRPLAVGVPVVLAVLWFGFDWWGSGSPWHGADAAQVSGDVAPLTRIADGLRVVAAMVPLPAWGAAAWVVVGGDGDGQRPANRGLAGAAAAWSLVVVAMAGVLGYAALSRFLLPAAALVCVLAGTGVARAVHRLRVGDPLRPALALAAGLALTVPRLAGIPAVVEEVAERAGVEDDLDHVLGAVDRATLLACDDIAVEATGLLRPAVAHKLDLPLHAVPTDLVDGAGVMLVRTGGTRHRAIARQDHTDVVLESSDWTVLAVRCPAAAPDT